MWTIHACTYVNNLTMLIIYQQSCSNCGSRNKLKRIMELLIDSVIRQVCYYSGMWFLFLSCLNVKMLIVCFSMKNSWQIHDMFNVKQMAFIQVRAYFLMWESCLFVTVLFFWVWAGDTNMYNACTFHAEFVKIGCGICEGMIVSMLCYDGFVIRSWRSIFSNVFFSVQVIFLRLCNSSKHDDHDNEGHCIVWYPMSSA